MPTALAISPHLDDAVFSAGGTLAQLARNGWRVIVATVFTASVAKPSGFALACQLDKGLPPDIDYMALRREEDAVACAIIGAEPLWLPFAEAPHRGYQSATDLFDGLRDDDKIIEAIAPALADLVFEVSPDAVFSPQAIGAHVDHVAVYSALRTCDRARWLWADFPYVARSVCRASPFADDLAELQARQNSLMPVDKAAKARAASAYASQIAFQFGGLELARKEVTTVGAIESFAASTRVPALGC